MTAHGPPHIRRRTRCVLPGCLSVPRRPSWRSSPRGPTNWADGTGKLSGILDHVTLSCDAGLSTLQSAATAAIPAGLAVAKSAVGTLLGRTGTASWLPARTDPASASTTN